MIDCAIARDELLDAAPDELAGIAGTELATHVRQCGRCGPLAQLMLDEGARLGSALALVHPRLSATAAASEILAPLTVTTRAPESRRERLGRLAAAAFPMAAAAALAAYIVYGNQPSVPYAASSRETPAHAVRITAPAGTGTIVLNTADPDITFAWIGKEIVP